MSTTLDRSIAPPVQPFSDIILQTPLTEVLANGVTLTSICSGDQNLVRLVILADGGRYDFATESTVAVMTEALREGTDLYAGAEIADIIDYNGARLGSRVSDHHCGLDLISLNSKLGELLPVMQSMLTAPAFDDRTVDMICRRHASNRAVQLTKVGVRASMFCKEMIAGPGHVASAPDSPEQIMAITADDLRECHRRSFGSALVHAYLAGRFDDATRRDVIAMLESLPTPSGASPISIEPFNPQAPRRIVDPREDALQSAVSMALPTIGREHDDYIPLRLALMALGGYIGSRLMANIREDKGLTYGIAAALLGTFEGAYASIDAQCDASYVDRVISETMYEIKMLRDKPVKGGELDRLKLKAWSTLASIADSPMSIIDHVITSLTVGTGPDYFSRQLETIKTLSPEIISSMADKYLLADQWRICVSGPN